MHDEKLIGELRLRLKSHTDAVRNGTSDEHDILPSLFSVLLESQIALDKNTEEKLNEQQTKQKELIANTTNLLTDTSKSQNELTLNAVKGLSDLSTKQTQSITDHSKNDIDDIRHKLASTTTALEQKLKIVIYASSASLILLVVIIFKLFLR
jgi:paraquat-inducible protein B